MNISDQPTREDRERAESVRTRQRTIFSLIAAVVIVSIGVLILF